MKTIHPQAVNQNIMNNFIIRAVSGLLFAGIFVTCILYSSTTFCLLFTLVTALSLDEFTSIVSKSGTASPNRTITVLAGSYLFLASFLFFTERSSAGIFIPYIFSLLFILGSEVHRNTPHPISNIAYSLASQIQIALPFALLNLLIDNEGCFSGLFPLTIFIFLWVNDTGAYLVGSLLHKRIPYQLAPRISPHKTWIGSIGGFLICLAAGAAIAAITQTYSFILWIGMALTVAISGTYGDLIESMIKRKIGIKDSGRFLPGHGGVLDRFDSSLLAIPACTVYLYLTGCLA